MPKILLTNPDLDDHALFTAEFSADLKDFVLRGWIPPVEAKAINQLPTESLQREALRHFLAELPFQTANVRYPVKSRFNAIPKCIYVAFASLCVVLLSKDIRYSEAMIPSAQTALPHFTVQGPPMRHHLIMARPVFRSHCPRAPVGFAVHAVPVGLRFSWKSVGAGYTYTLYRGDALDLGTLHEVKDHIRGTSFTLRNRGFKDSRSWWVICGVNSYGGEGPLSGAVTLSR